MNLKLNFFIKHYHKLIIVGSIAAAVMVFGWSAVLTPKYSSYSRVLVIAQNYDMSRALQTSARMAQIWQEIIRSTSFLNSVLESGFNLDKSNFNNSSSQKEAWEKTVKVKSIPNSGILKIEVIHPSRQQALFINQAIHSKLTGTANEYFGYGNDVKVLDKAKPSDRPTHPRLWLNSLVALILGFIVTTTVCYWHYYYKFNKQPDQGA